MIFLHYARKAKEIVAIFKKATEEGKLKLSEENEHVMKPSRRM